MKNTRNKTNQIKVKSSLIRLDNYLSRQSNFKSRINNRPTSNLGFVVVIPAFDEPDIIDSLDSLRNTLPPTRPVEVVVILNSSEKDTESLRHKHRNDAVRIEDWDLKKGDPDFRTHTILLEKVSSRYAGAGFARKTGMDEAVARFLEAGSVGGIICSLDSDTICDENYFLEIEKAMNRVPATGAGSIYFEHPVSGKAFPPEVYEGIILYELHLRYYIQAMRFTGFPQVHHTVGSAFFVTADSYAKAGGMNRRKAGEDFYFLQKIMTDCTFIDLNTTCVHPSPRPSSRVPFGTGPWIEKFLTREVDTLFTYNLGAFLDLALFFGKVDDLAILNEDQTVPFYFTLPKSIRSFINQDDFLRKIGEIKGNTASPGAFVKRFYKWFNGFRVIKFLNHSHQEIYSKKDILIESEQFLRLIKNGSQEIPQTPLGKLQMYREMEKH